jgi:hypothetical protein
MTVWVGGSTQTSSLVRSFGSYNIRLQARRARSTSAKELSRTELVNRGVNVTEVFHKGALANSRLSGPDPARHSYASYASFSDPDGNSWLLQEVTARLPGRTDAHDTTFTSSSELAAALRRAEVAHGEHEKRTGQRDTDWPDWYAEYIASEQAGKPLPS